LTFEHCLSSCLKKEQNFRGYTVPLSSGKNPTWFIPIDRASPYLWTPELIQSGIYKPNNTPSAGVKNMWSFEMFVLTPADNLGCVCFTCPTLHCFWCPELGTSPVDWAELSKLFT
jgi:hypothetical protein